MANYLDFVIDHQQSFVIRYSFVIRCSFCEAVQRVDIPIGEQSSRGMSYDNIKTKLSRDSRDKGWRTVKTTHNVRLNYCPDHAHLIQMINPPQERPEPTRERAGDRDS